MLLFFVHTSIEKNTSIRSCYIEFNVLTFRFIFHINTHLISTIKTTFQIFELFDDFVIDKLFLFLIIEFKFQQRVIFDEIQMFKNINMIQLHNDSMLYKSFLHYIKTAQNKTKKKVKEKKQTYYLLSILIIVCSNKIIVKNRSETNITNKKI